MYHSRVCSALLLLAATVLYDDNLWHETGHGPGPTERRIPPGSRLFDTLIHVVYLEDIFEETNDFGKISVDDYKSMKIASMQRVNINHKNLTLV